MDPINKDELLAPDGTFFAVDPSPVRHPRPTEDPRLGAVEPAADATVSYHGDASDELSGEANAAGHRDVDLFDDVFGFLPTSGNDNRQGHDHYHQSPSQGFAPASSTVTTASPNIATSTITARPPDHTQEHRDLHPSDMNRLRHDHSTAGYREGLSAGKNKTLQVGFDEGYPLGAALGTMVGGLLGLLEALVVARPADTRTADGSGEFLSGLLARARQELTARSIYSPMYFAPDGTWIFELDEGGEAGECTIYDVAGAHPLIKTWRGIVDKQLDRANIRWGKPGEEAALAAAIGLVTEDEEGSSAPAQSGTRTASTTSPRADGAPTASRAPTSSNVSALDW
ncbi:Essential protein Yae1, N terminal [Sporothrix epigloea]|uniref:Protein YAE1 n=1 Tax=Sporothrix epigloea TaxID=1892477 RepID=A0ABP0E7A5_9PEZI